jgi:hypothetical protein
MATTQTPVDTPPSSKGTGDGMREPVHRCVFMSQRAHGIWNDLGWAVIAIITLCAVLVAAEH